MERSFVCDNGHSFKVFDDSEEAPDGNKRDVDFGIPCPLCGAISEVTWPSNRGFKVIAS